MNNNWVIDSTLLQNTKAATAIKEHFTKEIRVGCQPACVNLETLTLYLEKSQY